MQIASNGDNLHETSNTVFWGKKENKCHQFVVWWISSESGKGYSETVVPASYRMEQNCEQALEQAHISEPKRAVALAVDESVHSENAFECKYILFYLQPLYLYIHTIIDLDVCMEIFYLLIIHQHVCYSRTIYLAAARIVWNIHNIYDNLMNLSLLLRNSTYRKWRHQNRIIFFIYVFKCILRNKSRKILPCTSSKMGAWGPGVGRGGSKLFPLRRASLTEEENMFVLRLNPCPAEPGYTLPLQTV